jgi:hypothetical protein
MPVARRIGLKIDVASAASEDAIFTGHGAILICLQPISYS